MCQFVSMLVTNERKMGSFTAPISLIMKNGELEKKYLKKNGEMCVTFFELCWISGVCQHYCWHHLHKSSYYRRLLGLCLD